MTSVHLLRGRLNRRREHVEGCEDVLKTNGKFFGVGTWPSVNWLIFRRWLICNALIASCLKCYRTRATTQSKRFEESIRMQDKILERDGCATTDDESPPGVRRPWWNSVKMTWTSKRLQVVIFNPVVHSELELISPPQSECSASSIVQSSVKYAIKAIS